MSHPSRPAAKSLAELIGPAIDPVVRKRGLARAELMEWWPDIVGAAFAGQVLPERIRWPRDGAAGATLVVRCDPAVALQFSYEADQVRGRLNTYFGYNAISAVRIVQQRIDSAPRPPMPAHEPEAPADLEQRIAGIDNPLKEALRALARGALARP